MTQAESGIVLYYGCLGSLISSQFVVFQPECLGKDRQSKNVMVKFGGNAIISAGDVSELGEIIRYNNDNKEIALVKLNQELNCKHQVQPICIELENDVPADSNQQIIVCGLSSNNYRYEWPYMVAVNTSFVEKKQCETQLGVTPSSLEKNICVSHNDYCMHDIVGGALTQEYKNKTHIIGMKYSDLCNHGKPTVHIDINKYRGWIREQISKP